MIQILKGKVRAARGVFGIFLCINVFGKKVYPQRLQKQVIRRPRSERQAAKRA